MSTTLTQARSAAGTRRRPVVSLTLPRLNGPASGKAAPPRRLWWSGDAVINFDDLGQVAMFYECALDAARSEEDLADWLNPVLLAELWPSLGMRRELQAQWEAQNPELAARTASAAAA